MTRARLKWEMRFAFGQIALSFTHMGALIVGVLTLNTNIEKQLDADLDAYVAKMLADQPA